MARTPSAPSPEGLPGLRRGGSATELLFLFECATSEPTQLRPVADRLGLTVQAVSHSFRLLRRRGLVEVRDGHYRPTVEGTAQLHAALTDLGADVAQRIERLHVVRSCRAIATADLSVGAPVSLELDDGLLTARPGGSGPSRGRVVRGGRRGALVEVGDLEGIVRLVPARISVRTISDADLEDPALSRRVAAALPTSGGIVAAEGFEAYYATRRATDRPIVRFAVGAACREASRIGVASTVIVSERELPRLVDEIGPTDPPRLDVLPLGRAGGRRGARAHR
jgi:predicted transcriptional regulator